MLAKIIVSFQKPKLSLGRRSGDDNNPRSSALKIIHPGGTTEHYYMATPAARIIDEYYPSFILARPDVFRKPWDSVVKRDEILTPGQKYLVVPRQTVNKLRRRIEKNSTAIKVVPSNHVSFSDQMIALAEYSSGSFVQRSVIKTAIKSSSKKMERNRRRVRFFGVDAKEDSSDFATSSESNGGSKSRRKVRAWNPSLTVITEK